jgi:adenine-specific DNA-methyltransferase
MSSSHKQKSELTWIGKQNRPKLEPRILNECYYWQVVCDEIFGRSNFVSSIVWEKDSGRKNETDISLSPDYILLYAKDRSIWRNVRNFLEKHKEQLSRYQNPDNDPRSP